MVLTRFSKAKPIPSSAVSTKKSSPTTMNFSKGLVTYKPNDTMEYNELYLAQNVRFDRIGEYITRRGLKAMSDPIGKTLKLDELSSIDEEIALKDLGDKEITQDGIFSIIVKAKKAEEGYGVLKMDLLDENDEVVASSCSDTVTTTMGEVEFRFISAPSGTFKVRLSKQGMADVDFIVGAESATGTLCVKLYSATKGSIIGLHEANLGGTKVVLFVFKDSAGTSTLYRMDEQGTVTSIRQLPSNVKSVRFLQNLNKIRYTDGQESPRLIDPASNWSDTAITTTDLDTDVDLQIKTSNIIKGNQNNIIYFDAETDTQVVWTYPYNTPFAKEADFTSKTELNAYVPGSTVTTTIQKSELTPTSDTHLIASIAVGDIITDGLNNWGSVSSISANSVVATSISHVAVAINSYDKFDRDFYQNLPSIETGDPLTAMFDLGGVFYFLTRRNKYYIYFQTVEVTNDSTSSAQHGTFSQESVACNLNYAFYANDDGIFMFDGSSEASITQNTIQNVYDKISNKEQIRLELFGNRLYVFYPSKAGAPNDSCLVYNLNLKIWESIDNGVYVSSTIARQTASNRFICGSSTFGLLFTFEDENNAYADEGAPIKFDIMTAYLHFGTPSQLHRITKWRPEFSTTPNPYTVKCGYAMDYTDDVKYAFSIELKDRTVYNEHYVWDNPSIAGLDVVPTKLSTIPTVYGEFRHCQIRYQHHSAFEPINLKSHTLAVQTQRLR